MMNLNKIISFKKLIFSLLISFSAAMIFGQNAGQSEHSGDSVKTSSILEVNATQTADHNKNEDKSDEVEEFDP
ncbi:MAG: hypothetical protein ABIR66_02930, partial [Saprospiraceae bacterium]